MAGVVDHLAQSSHMGYCASWSLPTKSANKVLIVLPSGTIFFDNFL